VFHKHTLVVYIKGAKTPYHAYRKYIVTLVRNYMVTASNSIFSNYTGFIPN